jgi:hypothetical protein
MVDGSRFASGFDGSGAAANSQYKGLVKLAALEFLGQLSGSVFAIVKHRFFLQASCHWLTLQRD